MKNYGLVLVIAFTVGCGSSNPAGDDDVTLDSGVTVQDSSGSPDAGTDGPTVCMANTESDPANCGACGRSCLGGSCTLGRCESQRLDSGDISGIGDFTVDALFLYYTGFAASGPTPHRLWKIIIGPAAGIDYLTLFFHPTPLSQIAFDGTDFYTAEPNQYDQFDRGLIKKTNKEPFGGMNLATNQKPTTTAVLQQAGFVYWATDVNQANGGDIKRVSAAGGAITTITVLAGNVAYLGADASNLFWVDDGGGGIPPALHRAPLGGGATANITSGVADFIDMDTANIYMVRKNTGELVSAPKAGGPVAILGQGMTAGGAVDDDHVYAAKGNKLVAVTKAGADAGTLWEGDPQGTAECPTVMKITRTKVIGEYVYFLVVPTTCNNATLFNAIYRVARL